MRDDPDFFSVRPEHAEIHGRLLNWARYVRVTPHRAGCTPMFKHFRSTEHWAGHQPVAIVDRLDGELVEEGVNRLPEKQKLAVRWSYVYSTGGHGGKVVPWYKATRFLAVTKPGLISLIHDARSILKNRARVAHMPQPITSMGVASYPQCL